MRWKDISYENGTLTVNQTLQRVDGRLQFLEPKTERSRRSINVPQTVLIALSTHRKRQSEEKLAAGFKWRDLDLVFATRTGMPLKPRNVHRSFKLLLVRASLPDLRFHDLRHTSASLLLAQNVAPRVIMEILGHSRISTTMDIYSHVVPSLKQEAADKMDQLLAGDSATRTIVGQTVGQKSA